MLLYIELFFINLLSKSKSNKLDKDVIEITPIDQTKLPRGSSDVFGLDKGLFSKNSFLDTDLDFISTIWSRQSDIFIDIQCCVLSALIYFNLLQHIVSYCSIFHVTVHTVRTLDNGIKYGIFSYSDNLFIVFKGTSTLSDFYTDVNINLSHNHTLPGRVHQGFLTSIIDDYPIILNDISKLVADFSTIFITGHSLGGALSVILFKLISTEFPFKDFRNITFGSPKIGDSDFVSKTITKRIVCGKDIISHLPFSYLGYSHVDILFTLPSYLNKFFPNSAEHHISSYYHSLKQLRSKNSTNSL